MSIINSELHIGQTATLQRIFKEEDLDQYNQLTKDFHPIYQRHEASWKKYFAQPIIPALLVEGLIIQVISDKLPGCACVLLQKELVYYHPAHMGDIITAELTIIDINHERDWITQKVICSNQNGTEIIKGQIVIFVLPGG